MKTNSSHSMLLAGAALALAGITTSHTIAGSDQEYRRNQGKTDVNPAITPVERAVLVCTDARLVTVTETKPSLPNGRGPQITTEVGKKLECTSCDTPMLAMKPSGHNGRGAMAPVEIRGRHDCTKNGCGIAVAIVN